jgi:hypothetical protein
MISRRRLLKHFNWRQKIDLNLDLSEYDDTLDTLIEKAKEEDIKALCDVFDVAFVKEDGLKKSRRELLIIFHNEPGLSALVVAPVLLGLGVYLLAGTAAMTTLGIASKLIGIKTVLVGDKILNLSAKYSEENIKKCRAIMSHILSTMPKKEVIKEIKEITDPALPDAKSAKSKKGGTRRRRR